MTLWLQARGPVAYFPGIYVAWFKLLAGERRRQLDRRLKSATATTTDAVFNPTFHLTDVSRQTRRLTWGRGTSSLLEVTGGRSITGEGDRDVGKLERPKHFEKFGAKTFWLFSGFFFPLFLFLIFFPKIWRCLNFWISGFVELQICLTCYFNFSFAKEILNRCVTFLCSFMPEKSSVQIKEMHLVRIFVCNEWRMLVSFQWQWADQFCRTNIMASYDDPVVTDNYVGKSGEEMDEERNQQVREILQVPMSASPRG